MFATVAEAMAWCQASDYQVCAARLGSSGRPGAGHISVADAEGDSDRFVRTAYYLVSRPDRVGDVSGAFAPGETLEYLPADGTAS